MVMMIKMMVMVIPMIQVPVIQLQAVPVPTKDPRVVQVEDLEHRTSVSVDLSDNHFGIGRELFNIFRKNVGSTSEGANSIL